MKTPIIAVSSSRSRMKNSLVRSWIDFHEARTQNGTRKVVRTTSQSEMPSMPMW